MLFSDVKMSSFRAKARLVFHWCLYSKRYYVAESLSIYHYLLNSKQTGYVTHVANFNVFNISGFLIVREKSFPRSG